MYMFVYTWITNTPNNHYEVYFVFVAFYFVAFFFWLKWVFYQCWAAEPQRDAIMLDFMFQPRFSTMQNCHQIVTQMQLIIFSFIIALSKSLERSFQMLFFVLGKKTFYQACQFHFVQFKWKSFIQCQKLYLINSRMKSAQTIKIVN